MASIHIREIDPEVLRALKVAAAKRALTLKDYVLRAVQMSIKEDAKIENLAKEPQGKWVTFAKAKQQ